MKPQLHEIVDLTIDRLGIHGEGVARYQGFTLFIDGALPQEKVRARISEVRSTFGRGQVLEILTASPARQIPPCPLFGRCGGCQLMHLSYEEQLKAKQAKVQDALERIGKLSVEVLPCIPSPQPLHYRNKIQLPINASFDLGLYAANSHDLIPIEQCFIHCPLGEKVLHALQPLLKTSRPSSLKHVLIKTAVQREEVLVVFVTKDALPLTAVAEQLMKAIPQVKGVVQCVNPKEGNVILGEEYILLKGQDAIQEKICDLLFKVSPASFFQVNPLQAEALYQQALQWANPQKNEIVVDAYCGVGTLTLLFAKCAKEAIGIEPIAQAITDAQENAQNNGITNAHFICGTAEEKIGAIPHIDIALLNPPRKGCDPQVLNALLHKCPSRILYVSCDPATLARDLQKLTEGGYHVQAVQPFDMFPQTMHVESLALLYKKKEDRL